MRRIFGLSIVAAGVAASVVPNSNSFPLGCAADFRIADQRIASGERVVLRLLDKHAGRLDLTQLGMEPNARETIDDLIHRPHGIILVTGPTGSTPALRKGQLLGDRYSLLAAVTDDHDLHLDRALDRLLVAAQPLAVLLQDALGLDQRLDGVAQVVHVRVLGHELQGDLPTGPADEDGDVALDRRRIVADRTHLISTTFGRARLGAVEHAAHDGQGLPEPAKALAEAGASVCVGTWPPALGIFETLLRRGKLDASLALSDGRKLEFIESPISAPVHIEIDLSEL